MIPASPFLSELTPEIAGSISSLGMVLKGAIVVWFVWQLDLLTRRHDPWTVKREVQPLPERRLTRPGLPDNGEFGRFERLVYAAYTWLVLAAFFEILLGATALFGYPPPISGDAIRHMYLVGFITHLIFGVSVRVIPGLLMKKRLASAPLVDATLWLGSTAVVCRVLPLMIPSGLFETIPASVGVAQAAFAFSGMIGLGAVVCLATNLWKTAVR